MIMDRMMMGTARLIFALSLVVLAVEAACDGWVFAPTRHYAAFERCRRVAKPVAWANRRNPPATGTWPRWVHSQGTQLLVSRGGFRGAVFQHVYKTGGTSATKLLESFGEGAIGGVGNPLKFEHLANYTRAELQKPEMAGCWPAASEKAPYSAFAFVREPLDRFFSGYYETLAREVARGPKSKKHDAIDQAIANSIDTPANILDAWIRARRLSNSTTIVNEHVGLQTWFLAYNTRLGTQNFQVVALWDVAKLDAAFDAAGYGVAANRSNVQGHNLHKEKFALNRSDVSEFAWGALCSYLVEDYVCLGYDPPVECTSRDLWPTDADIADRLRGVRPRR